MEICLFWHFWVMFTELLFLLNQKQLMLIGLFLESVLDADLQWEGSMPLGLVFILNQGLSLTIPLQCRMLRQKPVSSQDTRLTCACLNPGFMWKGTGASHSK